MIEAHEEIVGDSGVPRRDGLESRRTVSGLCSALDASPVAAARLHRGTRRLRRAPADSIEPEPDVVVRRRERCVAGVVAASHAAVAGPRADARYRAAPRALYADGRAV